MDKERKDYAEIRYSDLCEGVTFKYKKLNPIEMINLVTKNFDFGKQDKDEQDLLLIQKILRNILWTKDGETWVELIQEDGIPKLPELNSDPTIALDLFYRYKADVLAPVFYESKTFQSFMKDTQKQKKADK